MDNNQGMISCALGCWLVAALGGFLAAVLLWVLGGWSFMQGVFVGAVVFAVAGLLLNWIMCRPLPAAGEATVGGKDAATAKAEAAGLTVIQNRCPKIEYQRLFGELRMGGFNTGVISSRLT